MEHDWEGGGKKGLEAILQDPELPLSQGLGSGV